MGEFVLYLNVYVKQKTLKDRQMQLKVKASGLQAGFYRNQVK